MRAPHPGCAVLSLDVKLDDAAMQCLAPASQVHRSVAFGCCCHLIYRPTERVSLLLGSLKAACSLQDIVETSSLKVTVEAASLRRMRRKKIKDGSG